MKTSRALSSEAAECHACPRAEGACLRRRGQEDAARGPAARDAELRWASFETPQRAGTRGRRPLVIATSTASCQYLAQTRPRATGLPLLPGGARDRVLTTLGAMQAGMAARHRRADCHGDARPAYRLSRRVEAATRGGTGRRSVPAVPR